MTVNPGDEQASELYPSIGDVASIYGDPSGQYAAFLDKGEPSYPLEPYFLWDQPLSDSDFVESNATTTSNGPAKTSTSGAITFSSFSPWLLPAYLAVLVGTTLLFH